MAGGTRSGGPQELAVFRGDRHVVDACFPAAHQSIAIEFPLLVAVRAKPMAGIIAPLILEANTDVVFMERPKLLDEPVIKFVGPFAGKEFDDGRAPVKKFRAVSPAAVFGIGKRDAGRVAAVPGILGKTNFF